MDHYWIQDDYSVSIHNPCMSTNRQVERLMHVFFNGTLENMHILPFLPNDQNLSSTVRSSCNGDQEMFFQGKVCRGIDRKPRDFDTFSVINLMFSLSILTASNLIISSVIILFSLWFASLALQSHFSSLFSFPRSAVTNYYKLSGLK